jgi:hypothetical protein
VSPVGGHDDAWPLGVGLKLKIKEDKEADEGKTIGRLHVHWLRDLRTVVCCSRRQEWHNV